MNTLLMMEILYFLEELFEVTLMMMRVMFLELESLLEKTAFNELISTGEK